MNSEFVSMDIEMVNGHKTDHDLSNFLQSKSLSNKDIILTKFLERLKIRTIPHISPLISRLREAEVKNMEALKSIDKINKRIKEIEKYVSVNSKVNKTPTGNVGVGADITDPSSEEFHRIMNAVQSSPFAPTKPPTTQSHSKSHLNSIENSDGKAKANVLMQLNHLQQSHNLPQGNHLTNSNINGASMMYSELLNKVGLNNTNKSIITTNNQCNELQLVSVNGISNNNNTSAMHYSYFIKYLPPGAVINNFSPPKLTWKRSNEGIVLEWTMRWTDNSMQPTSYHIYSFQQSEFVTESVPWKLIGKTIALPLPMSCTLNMVDKSEIYYFVIRATINDQCYSLWSNLIIVEIKST